MAAIQINKPIKVLNLTGVKKLILYNSGNVRLLPDANKHHHQKANTQNFNIYNIIHNPAGTNNKNNDCASRSPKLAPYNTTDLAGTHEKHHSFSKTRPITNAHDVALKEELELYKGEVERRYKASTVNRSYEFPRNFIADFTPDEFDHETHKKAIPVSIYDKLEIATEKIQIKKQPTRILKSYKIDTSPFSRNPKQNFNTTLYKRIQKILKKTTYDNPESRLNQTSILPHDTLNTTLYITPTAPGKSATPYLDSRTLRPQFTFIKNQPVMPSATRPKKKGLPLLTSMDMVQTSYFGSNNNKKHSRTKTDAIIGKSMVLKPPKGKSRIQVGHFKTIARESGRTETRLEDYRAKLNESACSNSSTYGSQQGHYRSYMK